MFLLKFLYLLAFLQCIQSARILSLMPFPGKSHYINIQPIMQRLAEIGHDVTVVTTHYEENPLPNYHQIIIDKMTLWQAMGSKQDKFGFENMLFAKEMIILWDACYKLTEHAFKSKALQEFINNDKSHYDVIIVELFFQEALYMFAHKYNAPIVAISTMGLTQYVGDFMGNPVQPAYMPHEFLRDRGKLDMMTRVQNLFYTVYDLVGRKYHVLPRHQGLINEHFKNLPEPIPELGAIERNVSLVLVNTHYAMDTVRPTVPGIIEVAGVHIKAKKKLPDDIQKFIDESAHGVIFFSLGSNLNSKDLPKEKLAMFLNSFKGLPQRILWKWEDENMPDKPDNVMVRSWLPQNDILAHPNVKLFITHGGLLSTIEAIHFGKPVIGIPVYGDQHLNAARAETMGFGIKLAYSTITEQQIKNALNEILNNKKYAETAMELANRFRDRPVSAMDSAIFWIEYVIRHKGAHFMRSPLLDLWWYETYMVDIVLLFFIIPLGLLIFILKKMFTICKKPKRQTKEKVAHKKKQ